MITATEAMGTRFELVIADERSIVRALAEEALREITGLHARFTRFAADSLISHINRTAAYRPVRLDRTTFDLFHAAQTVCTASNGAFDITVGTGSFLLDADACSIAFNGEHVSLDLGAIAKGFALDRAAAVLREGGVTAALLHGGTSSVVGIGAPPGADAWRVALAHSKSIPYVELRDAALSVSRPFSQVYDGLAHIVDPRTRVAVQERRFTLVMGPSATLADAWSTAIAVLGDRPPALTNEWQTHIEAEYE